MMWIGYEESDGQIESSSGKSFVRQNHLDVILLSLSFLEFLLLSLLLGEIFQLKSFKLFLQSLIFNLIFKNSLLIILYFLFHADNLIIFLIQRFLINGNHLFLLNGWLSFQNLL